ncbi:hypothetical protein F0562_015444 [Nyssa sinensis]|uniref:Uncharacterized protein n=1 Tax=Nyssa sinensis TaxID=561372 RepID=A0A5J4ZHB7_9ASTE|nr:hypothetical protein F0562_015444 [Nyssa sinensis]
MHLFDVAFEVSFTTIAEGPIRYPLGAKVTLGLLFTSPIASQMRLTDSIERHWEVVGRPSTLFSVSADEQIKGVGGWVSATMGLGLATAEETIVNGVASEVIDRTVVKIIRREECRSGGGREGDHADGHRVSHVQA